MYYWIYLNQLFDVIVKAAHGHVIPLDVNTQ